MGKNSSRNAAKQRQKRAVKQKIRQRTNRNMAMALQQMRYAAARDHGKNTVEGSKDLKRYDEDTEVEIFSCDGVGDCCMNAPVILDHDDVFRVFNNSAVRETFGIETTKDMFFSDSPILKYWVSRDAGVPMCVARRDKNEADNEECVFLISDEKGRRCMLGNDRPTVCRCTPVRRVAHKAVTGQMTGWKFIVNNIPCEICDKALNPKKVVIKDLLAENDMDIRHEKNGLYHGFCAWLSKNVKADEARKLAGMLLFDWDTYAMEIGKVPKEKVMQEQPPTSDSLLLSARTIIGMLIGDKSIPTLPDPDTQDNSPVQTTGDSRVIIP